MAIQGAPRRLRGQNPNAPQIPAFSPNDFGGQLGNMQIGNMGGMTGSQPMANTVNNKQEQGNMGGGGLMGGAFGDILGQFPGLANAIQMPVDDGGFNRPPNVTNEMADDFYQRQLEFNQNNLTKYGGDREQTFDAFTQANPNLDPYLVNEYRNSLSHRYSAQPYYEGPSTQPSFDGTQFYAQTGASAPTNNGVNNMANPYTTDVLTGPAASTSGPSDTMAYGGALLGGLLGNDLSGALQAAGGYYAGQQGIEGAMATGQAGLGLGESMGKRAYDQSQFRPFGVTSNLANVQTTPEGGVNLNLSPEQQAMQQQLLGQSRGLFGQVGADPAAAQSALYEQIRATQQPEEERQRLQMQENLFSSGRGGVQTAMYGGTPEQMAYEKARQESMLNANLAARTQSQAEQLQAGQLGGMLQQAGYDPQRQAIDLFGASGVPSQLAAKGQLGGAELQSQAGGRGLESYMQGANMANLLQQQQLQGLMTGAVGKPLTAQEQLMNAMIGRLGGTPIEAGGGMLGGVLDWGKELLGFGSDKPNFTLNPSEIDKLSDAEKEQALYDLFN